MVATTALLSTGCVWSFETLDGDHNGPTGNIDADVGYGTSDGPRPRPSPRVPPGRDPSDTLRQAYYTADLVGIRDPRRQRRPQRHQRRRRPEPTPPSSTTAGPTYSTATARTVTFVTRTGTVVFWAFETLDGNGAAPTGRINADVGWSNATILYDGRPHVFYHDSDNGDLRHTYYTGTAVGLSRRSTARADPTDASTPTWAGSTRRSSTTAGRTSSTTTTAAIRCGTRTTTVSTGLSRPSTATADPTAASTASSVITAPSSCSTAGRTSSTGSPHPPSRLLHRHRVGLRDP